MKLLMLKIGARPKGRLIEQHDIIFAVVDDFTQVIDIINNTWKEVKNTWHIDAWREVNRVGDFKVEIAPHHNDTSDNDTTDNDITENKLFFVNLGGYLPNVFEEFHYKTLVVAPTLSQATAQAKKCDFYTTYDLTTVDSLTGITGVSHVDDKRNVDVDEIHCVNTLVKDFTLTITPLSEQDKQTMPEDEMHIGYLSIKKIRNFFV